MSITELITDLSHRGVRLWLEGDQLRFKAPQGALTSDLKARLVERKGDVLEFLRQVQSSLETPASPPISPAPRDGNLPLSYSQERMWFTAQWEPESAAYNISDAVVIEGHIDLLSLQKSLDEIVRRHEILRTSFVRQDGKPVQKIAPEGQIRIKLIELDHLDAAEREAETQRILNAEASTTFDLEQSPLLRAALIKLEADRHILLVSAHHIVSDGWSTGVLIRELMSLYTAFSNGQPSPLPPLPIQYADFAVWQRQWLAGERLESEAAFWREQLKGAPESLNLPTDKPRPAARSSRGTTYRFELSPSLSSAVQQLSQRERVTPFTVLLAAWNVLLSKYTAQRDVVVGAFHANRNRTELENLIGVFVNSLVVRTDLTGNPSFRELLARVRDVTVTAQAHLDLPFEKLVEELQLERDLSRTPVYQVAFNFQNAFENELNAPGLVLRRLQLPNETAKFDLSLVVTDTAPCMTGELEYSTDLFEEATVVRMGEHYQTLLEAATADPARRIGELPLMTAAEQKLVLEDWNETHVDYDTEKCAHHQFEEWVERTPDAPAAVFESQQVTYRELNERANRLARHLRRRGVRSEVIVGICIEPSIEMVVAIFGVLKAGGAYLPLDSAYPDDRLVFMCEHSGTHLILTQPHLAERVRGFGSFDVLPLENNAEQFAEEDKENLPVNTTSGNTVYVIYTSGSTGRPKGIMIQHRNLINFVLGYGEIFHMAPGDRTLQFSSFSFDQSVREVFETLLSGATLCLASLENKMPGEPLIKTLRDMEITNVTLVPSVQAHLPYAELPALQRLSGGGEAVTQEIVNKWGVGRRYFNVYGPTEITFSNAAGELFPGERVTIGRPIANTKAYILDAYLQPVPIGVPGELYIGGDGLARGYMNRPDLTADKFIADPFSSQPGARMYRSGDLVRYLPNGRIEYYGRIDFQVKIRGFRIELGEIESTINRFTGIAKSVVVASETSAGEKQLVAYFIPENGEVSIPDLKNYLKQNLPQYMIPSSLVMLDHFPLTPNGKLDVKALPAPQKTRRRDTSASPRTMYEELLAEIWADTLQLDRVDVNDNFFEIGGHSLLATQVASKISDSFSVNLPLRTLFESPTLTALAERIQAAVISGEDLEIPPIHPASRNEALPLSFAQENLWLFEQLTPGTPTYNTCRSGRIWGPLNTAALESAFNDLLQRHEALRTTYDLYDETPVQIVNPHEHYTLPIIDLTHLSEDEREAAAFQLSNEEAQLPIDLTKSPVARAKVLRLGEEDHVFVMSIHHIAYDLWSGGVLLGEMEQLYLAHVDGGSASLPVLPVQAADFGVWQRNWLQGEVLERQLSYWKEKLAGLSATPLDLPTDRPRPAVETMNGDSEYVHFPQSLNADIQALARREGVTQFMVLMAIFQVLLHRYTNQDDLPVGSVIANRNRAELDNVVGFFDNPIVLRVDASGNPTFREFLSRVRDVALEAYSNQYLPFDLIVKELQPERTSNRTPFIQAMFVFLLNYPAMEREIAGLKVVPYKLNSGKAMFDLLFGMRESDRGLEGELAYNCDLFDGETIARMGRHFGQLMEAVVADPNQRIRELAMLSEDEEAQLLFEWNETRRAYNLDHRMDELFERQVERTPERIALSCAGDQISYGRLNERANQLAHYLKVRGVGPEVPVGICLERSIDLVVAILGVLKAGGAYVPLDPDYPADRVTYMLRDAGAPIILTSTKIELIASEAAVETIYLDADWERIASESTASMEPVARPDNLAYVIYTSGSTGRPKGVGITHRSAVAFLNWADEAFPEKCREGLLAATSVCFDLSIFELFLPLCFGGRIILTDNILALPDLPQKEEVTLINTVPSAIRELLREDVLPHSTAIVNLAGEALSADLVRKLYAALPEHQLYNLYGPTETTTYSTFTPIASSVTSPGIGRPIANTQVYVLDRDGNPAGTGVPGELYIGGAGLARGYLNRPDLTAEKFVPNGFSTEPGARMYRTGDRVRSLSDGTLEFLGRIDHQVKVRGYRIELGEIESVLSSHPAVREAVVILRDDEVVGPQVVAYLVAPGDLSVADLRAYLQTKLPGYMIPGAFVRLKALPLTPNGKLDRKSLPAPGSSELELPEFVEPQGPGEELVASVWRQVLGVDRVGANESFFELGGHSLLATQVASRVRQVFGVEIQLRRLFEQPTVAGLAKHIEAARANGHDLGDVSFKPLVPVPRNRDLPLSFAQERMWVIHKLVANCPVYNIPSAIRLQGQLNIRALEEALTEIVRRHETLRTSFVEIDGEPLQVISPPYPVSLTVTDLTALDPAERAREARRLAETDAALEFDFYTGPLLRVSLLRLEEEEHVILLTIHHIVSDGWSMEVLMRELTTLYEAFAEGRSSPLPELPIQYADFAIWQKEWLSGPVFEAQLEFWRKTLSGISDSDLPTDKPRPPVQSFNGATAEQPLPEELTRAVKALNLREGVTLFMTLLAAFKILLRCYTGRHDIVVGTPIANRNIEATEPLIGFFANNLVLRTEVADERSFSELLATMREVALDAFAHQDLPFEKLVEELRPERDFSRNPLVQVFFMLQNEPALNMKMGGLKAELLEAEFAITKFDLLLYVTETSGGGLVAGVEYSTDLFESTTIKRMVDHYQQLLEELVAAPHKRLSELAFLKREEFRELSARADQKQQPQVLSVSLSEEQPYVAPRDAIEFGLVKIWEKLLEVEGVGIRDNFFDLGGYSLLGTRLMAEIKKQFGRELQLALLLQSPTIEQLARALRQHDVPTLQRSPLVPIQAEGTRPPFFCVHPVGGNVICYNDLARQLGPDQPFYAFQSVLSDEQEPQTVESMARLYLQHLRTVQPQGPYRIGGWSMGGVIAYEMAQHLSQVGERVQVLALIDSFTPVLDTPEHFEQRDILRLFIANLEGVFNVSLGLSEDDLRDLSVEETFAVLLERARASEMLPSELGVAELQGLFEFYRANSSALFTYEPRPYAGKVTLLRTSVAGAPPLRGWDEYASDIDVFEIDADHYSIINGPPLKVLAARLSEILNDERLSSATASAGTSL